jgi:hypothetical protein
VTSTTGDWSLPARRARLGLPGWLGLLIAGAASAIVYAPLLQNYFASDDFLNLYRILNCGFWEYILTPHGGHTLVARNLVFYLCDWAFGTNPAGYFWLVLITHVINVALLFRVVHRMTDSTRLACFGATVWGTSPVHDGALGWYAVYGHVMATTAVLLILHWVLDLDLQPAAQRRRTLRACYIAALIGMISFGVGIGIALVLPFVIALLAPATRSAARARLPLLSLFVVVPAVYVGLFAINGFFFGEGLETPSVVVKYIVELWNTIVPNTLHLLSYGIMRLLTAFRFDSSWVTPSVSYTVLGAFAVLTLAAAARASANMRRAMLASALLALACYGVIAMGRAVFFQALTSSMMAIQPRYHYTALIPVTLLVCLALASIASFRIFPDLVKTVALVWALLAIGITYANSDFQVDHHAESRSQVDEVMTAVMTSVGAANIGDDVYIPNRSFSGFFVVPPTIFPGWAAVFAIYEPSDVVEGRHVYFVDKRPGVLVATAKGKRSSRLIVAPPAKEP